MPPCPTCRGHISARKIFLHSETLECSECSKTTKRIQFRVLLIALVLLVTYIVLRFLPHFFKDPSTALIFVVPIILLNMLMLLLLFISYAKLVRFGHDDEDDVNELTDDAETFQDEFAIQSESLSQNEDPSHNMQV